jgi:hypothetical protein
LLDVQYSDFEIIVSVDRVSEEGEAVRRGVESGFGAKGVRAVAAEGEMSPNAKIDAMQAGLAEAENDVVRWLS